MQNILHSHSVHGQAEKTLGACGMWLQRHPRVAFFATLVGAPVCLLSAVFACAGSVMMSVALVMGWL